MEEEKQTVEVIFDRGRAPAEEAAPAAEEICTAGEAPAPEKPKRRRPRRAVNHVFCWLLFYNVLILVLSGIATLAGADMGLASALPPVAAVGLVYLFTRKWPARPFETHKKMTGKAFFTFFCLLCTVQIVSSLIMTAVTAAGATGTSVSIDMSTFTMVLYVGFTGPFCEEMMYRGFAGGKLKEYGKVFAIVLSALAFGLMHMNLEQLVVGFLTGLLFGYMFTEYSVLWTILLHIVNNFVLSAIPELICKVAPADTVNGVVNAIALVFAVCGAGILIRKRGAVAAYLRDPENRAERGTVRAVLTSFWFWLFVLIYLGAAVYMMIDPELAAFMTDIAAG